MLFSTMIRRMSAMVILIVTAQQVFAQLPSIQYFRPYDQRGINVFETGKEDSVAYEGLKLRLGANFKQTYQSLKHENSTEASAVPANKLMELGRGFNLAMANLNMDVQLADGVRVSLISYMSTRHHPEFWVKGGYFQIDKVGFLNSELLNNLWKNVTLKVGHFEINYGDQHFRRSDAGQGMHNPFVENYIMDAFTTEIGAELYWQKNGILAMVGMTDGEIQGNVTKPNDRSPSIYGKLGYDKQVAENVRVRLTGSLYTTKSSIRNTLYAGDRAGSHYYLVMENTAATQAANFTSGRFSPNFTDNVRAIMINPFIKVSGLELFGTYEIATGNTAIENGEIQPVDPAEARLAKLDDRKFTQTAIDALYRFGTEEKFYVGLRYNSLSGENAFGQKVTQNTAATPGPLNAGTRGDIKINRLAFGAGWFITKNVLFKAEYVQQEYKDFPAADRLNGGKFSGWLVEGVIGF